MKEDIILDTHAFADFLAQYFDVNGTNRAEKPFVQAGHISTTAARRITAIAMSSDEGIESLIVASTAAFIEILNKWDEVVAGRFTLFQFDAFLRQPPDWFIVASIDEDLLPPFLEVPAFAYPDGKAESIELMDALHVATAYSREAGYDLISSDRVIRSIPRIRII